MSAGPPFPSSHTPDLRDPDEICVARSGLFGFASTTFILSMYNVSTRGITTPNVVVGMALFVGGLAQFVAGMWEFACANAFGATGMFFAPPRRATGLHPRAWEGASCRSRRV